MKRIAGILLLTTALLLQVGCDASEDDTSGLFTLSGRVLNDDGTNNPIEGALVRVLPYGLEYITDAQGRFSADVEIDSTMDLQLIARADRYAQDEATVVAIAGRSVDVTLYLRQTVSEGPTSGRPSNLLLLEQSTQQIGVKESGAAEVAQLTFQVADSAGNPVVLDQASQVRFRLGARPGGGEFISPEVAMPDNNGLVTVNLSSGTRAGVVQLVAETTVSGRTIRSKPVSITIHGGLPDQAHFTIAPQQFNFPGLVRYNEQNGITVIVGDKYGNPVKPGTAVYFTSDYGIVEGSVLTSATGQGSVTYYSANPLPFSTNGFATITATTADEDQNPVTGSTTVLLSGHVALDVEPQVARFGSYRLVVSDVEHGSPLAPGTRISVRAEGTKVKAVGSTSITLGDYVTPGSGTTEFTFAIAEDNTIEEEGSPTVETLTITVSGPNGELEVTLVPAAAAQIASPSAYTVQTLGNALSVQLEE